MFTVSSPMPEFIIIIPLFSTSALVIFLLTNHINKKLTVVFILRIGNLMLAYSIDPG